MKKNTETRKSSMATKTGSWVRFKIPDKHVMPQYGFMTETAVVL